MTVLPWKAITAAFVIFAAGVVSGGMAARFYRTQSRRAAVPALPAGPPMPWVSQRLDFMRRLAARLDLTAEQRERIDRHVRESQQRMRELWQPIAPQFKEELHRLRKSIDDELTPDQRTQFQRLQRQRPPGAAGEHPSSRWREGEPPRRRPPGTDAVPPPTEKSGAVNPASTPPPAKTDRPQ